MATFATNALHYRGIGSGIVRILAEYPEIEIANDVNGKEFKVIILRKKHLKSTQENGESTQENKKSTQENKKSTQENKKSTQETILHILMENPKTNRKELAEIIGLSEDGIKKQLAKLKKEGLLERIGSTKAGYWKVISKQD